MMWVYVFALVYLFGVDQLVVDTVLYPRHINVCVWLPLCLFFSRTRVQPNALLYAVLLHVSPCMHVHARTGTAVHPWLFVAQRL